MSGLPAAVGAIAAEVDEEEAASRVLLDTAERATDALHSAKSSAAGRSSGPRCSGSGRTSWEPARWPRSYRADLAGSAPRSERCSALALRRRPPKCARPPSQTSWRWPSSTRTPRPAAPPCPGWTTRSARGPSAWIPGCGARRRARRSAHRRPRCVGRRRWRAHPAARRAAEGMGAGREHRRQRGRHQRGPRRLHAHRRPDRRRGRHHCRDRSRQPEAARGDLRRGKRRGVRRAGPERARGAARRGVRVRAGSLHRRARTAGRPAGLGTKLREAAARATADPS